MAISCLPLPFIAMSSCEPTPLSVANTPSNEPPANAPDELSLKFTPTVPLFAVVM